MVKLEPKHIAWLLPLAYATHLLEEYFIGEGLAAWFSDLFKVSLSVSDFIVINTIAFVGVVVVAILYNLHKINEYILAVLGSLFFVNGLIHLAATVITSTYSPGTISGVIFNIPLGVLIFKMIFPRLPEQQRSMAFTTGIILHIVVTVIAFNI